MVSVSPSSPLPKHYDPARVEGRRYAEWMAAGVFHEEPDPARPAFVIAMPPPNITGRAHLGHASTYTAMDVLMRYHRMLGENATWLPGQDHAAIATEAVLIRELAKTGQTKESLGRKGFLDYAWKWREQYGGIINDQFRMLGFGADWSRERFTMDAGLSAAVNRAFVTLYNDGLIYRGRRLINWDPMAQSTLSDAEVEYEERDGTLWQIRYDAYDGGEGVVVATTRPETLLGDMAVAVHPEDARYRHLIGKQVILPLIGRLIRVVADTAVDPTFGTGALKVTPAHDPMDYEIGLTHHLPMPSILDLQARIASDDPVLTGDLRPFAGLDRFEAREAIIKALREAGNLVREDPYRHTVSVSSRSHAIIEPMLSLQWFCKMESLAKPALDAYTTGQLRFIAARNGKTFEQWLRTIRDWNISRQIWWGHRLPVWYTPNDDVLVAATEEEARKLADERFGNVPLRRDDDTLDTWFSSALWPFSILGWPEQTPELGHWYPTQVLVTAREIIFLWVSRMVMLGLKLVGTLPFTDVLITPLVFDDQGRKMSKSLGNAIDPLDLIARYGADATRFGTLRQMHLEAQELRFSESRCAEAARFMNKIWNALLYAQGLPEGLVQPALLPTKLSLADRWILAELHAITISASAALDSYDFSSYLEGMLDFVWYRLCDWYLEASKHRTETRAAVLSFTLNTTMRLLHPIMPFITEEIWQTLPHDGRTIVTASWPDPTEIPNDRQAHTRFEALILAVKRVRHFRAQTGVKPNERVELRVPGMLEEELQSLLALLCTAHLTLTGMSGADATGEEILAATTVRADPTLLRGRLEREQKRLTSEVERSRKKLSNEAFVQKASLEAVEAERTKLEGYETALLRTITAIKELESGNHCTMDLTMINGRARD